MKQKTSKAPQEIIDRQKLLEGIFDRVPAMIGVYNLQTGKYVYVNEAIRNILGFTPKNFTEKGIPFVASLVHPDDLQRITKENIKLLELDENFRKKRSKTPLTQIASFEYRMRHKNGKWVWLHTEGSVFDRSPDGSVLHVINTSIDITSRKEAEERLKELSLTLEKQVLERTKEIEDNQGRMRLAVEAGKIGTWDWDIKRNVLTWSDRLFELHGVKKRDFQGTVDDFSKTIHPEERDRVQEAINRALSEKKGYQIEFRAFGPKGKIIWISTWGRVLYDKEGKPERMLGATIDVTERRKLENQKDEFIGIASHELKTPVTSIKVYTEVLERHFKAMGDPGSASMLSKMNSHVDKLTNLIRDLLDATKIEGGKMRFDSRPFDLNKLVFEVAEELQRTTEKHRLVLKGEVRNKITGDKERIGQVITNLVTNAIKYSPKADRIIVTLGETKEGAKVSVRDFGIGIPQKNLEHVFERFFRVEGGSKGTYPGLGLGLYISSEIIRRQGGRIWATSEEGKGSIFSFVLPIRTAQKNKGKRK